MQSIKKTQWLILLAIIIIMTALLTLDLKPPGTGNGMRAGAAENKSATADINMDTEIATAKKGFADNTNKMILQLEKELSDLSGNEKELKIKELAEVYANNNQFTVAALYYLSGSADDAKEYILAAEAFRKAYKNISDSSLMPTLIEKATTCFQSALEKDPNNLDAKSGLGSCIVDAGQNPMQGIQLLLAVVKVDSLNLNANLNLGLFSMKSGQFDKAIKRFETVAKLKPNAEIYGMLADAYEQTGNNEAAIAALKKAKAYIIDKDILVNIDNYIKNLKK
jgi:tetratricopeptide (TPR) repeat protein